MLQGQRPEAGRRILRENHHFGAATGRCGLDPETFGGRPGVRAERREAVLEHRDIVATRRQLRWLMRIGRRCEGVEFGGRKKRPLLTMGRVGHPFPAQRVPAQVRAWLHPPRGVSGRRRDDRVRDRRTGVQPEAAAVRPRQRALEHDPGARPAMAPGAATASRRRAERAESSDYDQPSAARSPPDTCRRTACSRNR